MKTQTQQKTDERDSKRVLRWVVIARLTMVVLAGRRLRGDTVRPPGCTFR